MTRHSNKAATIPARSVIWVSTTAMRNFMLDDPIIDWLELYGAGRGLVRDDQLNGYDERADYARFLFRKSKEFESAVLQHLRVTAGTRGNFIIQEIERPGPATPDDEIGHQCVLPTIARRFDEEKQTIR